MKQLVAATVMYAIACGGSSKPTPAQPALANKPGQEAPPPASAPAPPPTSDAGAPTDAEVETVMAQAATLFVAMGDAIDAAGGDCGKTGAAIEATLDANDEFLATNQRWRDNPAMMTKVEAWMQAHMDEVMPHVMKITTAGQTCAGQPAFDAAMRRLKAL